MAQEFVVLQCCQCNTYQVQQSKKATKWLCKMCNQKQSFKQFFGRGSAKECRLAVQALNRQRFEESALEGQIINANNNSKTPVDDSEILDMILANEDNDDNCDSSDDMSAPKRPKMTTEVDENIESCALESNKNPWNHFNRIVGQRVSKWSEFAK